MISTKQHFIYNLGGENEGGAPKKEEDIKDKAEEISESKEDKPTMVEKIKEALQDWSNDDKADEDFDNTQV